MAAIFDLLTSQCDRNPGNVFVSEDGQISLIDNADGLGNGDSCTERHTLNSMFLPSTAEHTYLVLGKKYAKRGVESFKQATPDPLVMVDYRYSHGKTFIGEWATNCNLLTNTEYYNLFVAADATPQMERLDKNLLQK